MTTTTEPRNPLYLLLLLASLLFVLTALAVGCALAPAGFALLDAVRGVAVRATGEPARDGLPVCEAVVSRALADPDRWCELGAPYVAPGGLLLAMLGKGVERSHLDELGRARGLELLGVDQFELPFSRAARAVVRWQRS